jgi:hypothetical protein
MRTVAPGRRRRVCFLIALTVATVLCSAGQTSAQGLLEFLFGRAFNTSPSALARIPHAAANPGSPKHRSRTAAHGERSVASGVAYCVRLCDGRYFPVQHHRASSPAEMCRALCPASPTNIFRGGEIARAIAADGTRYVALRNAFVYRERIVPGCTCNGKTSFGLAPVAISADPTLRAGDAVATADGALVFTGKSFARVSPSGEPAKRAATFVSIMKDQGRLSDIRRALASGRWAQADR